MVTSRTGTSRYKAWRVAVLQAGLNAGTTRCPCTGCPACKTRCRVWLDYTQGKRPNSAEPDHITPWSKGGDDIVENGRVICRRCNQSRGNGTRRPAPKTQRKPVNSEWINGSGRW